MPQASVKWFDEFLLNESSNIDVWLSLRLNRLENKNKYKYLSELRLPYIETLLGKYKQEFDQKRIQLVTLNENVTIKWPSRNENVLSRQKRFLDLLEEENETIVGNYVSHEAVCPFLFVDYNYIQIKHERK